MNITTTARHCTLDNDVLADAQRRLERLSRFARDITGVHLVVTAEKRIHTAEITLKLKGHELVSRENADQPKMAVALASERLEHQIRKIKERRADWRKGDRARAAAAAPPVADGDAPPAGPES